MALRWTRGLAMALFVAAGVFDLPALHLLIDDGPAPPFVVLPVGLLAMGLAWSGGCALEGRRGGTVLVLGGIGVLQGVAPFAPVTGPWIEDGAAPWMVASSIVSAIALGIHAQARPTRPAPA